MFFQAAVLDPAGVETAEARFKASKEFCWRGRRHGTAILTRSRSRPRPAAAGSHASCRLWDLHFLVDPGRASALQGTRASEGRPAGRPLARDAARARHAARGLARTEEIQRLHDKTRLRKALADDHTRGAERLHVDSQAEGRPSRTGPLDSCV